MLMAASDEGDRVHGVRDVRLSGTQANAVGVRVRGEIGPARR
jgi:hypothetical protein